MALEWVHGLRSILAGIMRFFALLFLFNMPCMLASAAEAFTAKTLGDYGNVTVMEVTGNYDARNPDGTVNDTPRHEIAREFYRIHKDEYDFFIIFSNFSFQMPDAKAKAFYLGVKNDIKGIGKETFDYSAFFGSDSRLQGTIDMGNIAGLEADPMEPAFKTTIATLSHELMHRWGAFARFRLPDGTISQALLGKDTSHWSFLLSTSASLLYGNQWQDNGNGTFTSIGDRKSYSPLDLYLMGMIDRLQVPPMMLIENPSIDAARMPETGATITGTAHTVSVDDIIAAEGERIPGVADSQKTFKSAFIFITSPGTFTGDELYGIENIRNGWLTHFSVLTDGKGIVQVAPEVREDIPENPGVTLPPVVTRTLPPNIEDGVSWLMSNQKADGSWMDLALTTERDTAEAAMALENFEISRQHYVLGLQWISSDSPENLDYLCRKICVVIDAGEDPAVLINDLMKFRNSDGGWGNIQGTMSSTLDTALALTTLIKVGYSDQQVISSAVDYLKEHQTSDGGWGDDDTGTIQTTSNVLSAFYKYRGTYQLDDKISKGIAWLAARQNPDGGFGNSPSTLYDTVSAMLALRALDQPQDITNKALQYILAQQSGDGSWNESTYQTALAVEAVWKSTVDPDLSIRDADISIIPSVITNIPSQIVVQARLLNLGRTAVPAAKVALYDGAIADANRIGEQIVAFPGNSEVTVTFQATARDGNEHYFHIIADPENAIKELNEDNNRALNILKPQATYDFEVLASDISVSPNTADIFGDVKITSKISNKGTMNAYNVQVQYSLDEAGVTFDIGTVTVDIPAGATITNEIIWTTNRAGENLPLAVSADPFLRFAETSEVNNRAVTFVTVNGSTEPNLSISHKDILITPSPANERGSATIAGLVRNEGFAAVSDVQVSCYKGDPKAGGVLLGSQLITSLNAGESSTVTFEWPNITDAGERVVYISVDPDGNIKEISRNDNDAFVLLDILSLPDFAISSNSISFSPAAPKEGDQVSVNVTVKNLGRQAAKNVQLTAREGSDLIGSQAISSIEGSGQAEAVFAYNSSGKKGTYEIAIAVDPDNVIMEGSDDNNSASKTFGVQDADLWLTEPYISPNGDGVKDSTKLFFRFDVSRTVKIILLNRKGQTVKTFSGTVLENTESGSVEWNGLDDKGMVAADGTYTIKVEGLSGDDLGSLMVVVDNNRRPITDAIGTNYLLNNNLTCMLPDVEPVWFPDESGLLFPISYPDPNAPEFLPGLYTMAPDGQDIRNLIPQGWVIDDKNISYSFYPFISPDGENIAVAFRKYHIKQYTSVNELWIMDREGRNLKMLSSNTVMNYGFQHVAWSHAGTHIAYSVGDGSKEEIWIIDTDSSEKTKIEETGNGYIDRLEWSPDSNRLLYTVGVNYYSKEVKIADLMGNLFTMAAFQKNFINPYWFSNEKIAVAEHIYDQNMQLELIKIGLFDVNGAVAPLQLTDRAFDFEFSPDKKHIVFSEYTEANVLVRLSDTAGNLATLYEAETVLEDWGEGSFGNLSNIKWSNDGERVAFVNKASNRIDSCTFESTLMVADINDRRSSSYKISDGSCYKTYDCPYINYNCSTSNSPSETFTELIGWLPSDSHLIVKTAGNEYKVMNAYAGSLEGSLALGSSTGGFLGFSPYGKYIAYSDTTDQSSICYGRGASDLWAMSSMLNLTSELRVSKNNSSIILRGIAADLNFESYLIEYADAKNPNVWSLVKPPSDMPVINDVLATWIPPFEGTFYVRLTVRDKAGNQAMHSKRVSWGISTSITALYSTQDIISPNNDGIKDEVELHYRVVEPAHLEFYIHDRDHILVRTFRKNHVDIEDSMIVWDGFDEAGMTVPDGHYTIKIFDYEFGVEVDNTPPVVNITLGPIMQTNKFTMDAFFFYATLYEALLSGTAKDKKLKSLVVEYGIGDNPQEWTVFSTQNQEEQTYEHAFSIATSKKTHQDTIINTIKDLVGRKYKITSEDFAGNKASSVSNMMEEKIFLICSGKQYHILETVRDNFAVFTSQYRKNPNYWIDLVSISNPDDDEIGLLLQNLPDADFFRVKAIDTNGNQFYSDEITSGCKIDGDGGTGDGTGGGGGGGGGGGTGGGSANPVLTLNVLNYPAVNCGELSGSGIKLSSSFVPGTLAGRIVAKTLSYYIKKPTGTELLSQIDLANEKWDAVTVETVGMRDGIYPVFAVFGYFDLSDSKDKELNANSSLLVDRTLPVAKIISVDACPMKYTDPVADWTGISVEATSEDNLSVKMFELHYGFGENPDEWFPAMTWQDGKPVHISGKGLLNSTPVRMDISELKASELTLRLKAVDAAGNMACFIDKYPVDTFTEIKDIASDIKVFSPNSDSVKDTVDAIYVIDEAAMVDAAVYRLNSGGAEDMSDAVLTKVIASGLQHNTGAEKFTWDGRDDNGYIAMDGRYAMHAFAKDSCGNEDHKWINVDLDNTLPVTMISWPLPSHQIGSIVEVRGTAEDDHFLIYKLWAGEGESPVNWTLISESNTSVKDGILGVWATAGLKGLWTLRLTAYDNAGNSSEKRVAIDISTRDLLINELNVVPKTISPNGDGRLDTATINYQINYGADIYIAIYDSANVIRRTHVADARNAGAHLYVWDGRDESGRFVTDGDYMARLTASPLSGSGVTEIETVTVTVDTAAPFIDMKQPAADSFAHVDFSVIGTISDAHMFEYSITNTGDTGTLPLDSGNQNRQDYVFGQLSNLTEGNYFLSVQAKDIAGNMNEKNISFVIDRTPPKVNLVAPINGEYFGSERNSISVSGSILEKHLDSFSLRYGEGDLPAQWTELLSGTSVPLTRKLYEWNVGKNSGIQDGLYTLTVSAKDKSGQTGEAKAKIIIDNTLPEVMILSPKDGDYIRAAAEITGSAHDQNPDRYSVEISEGSCSNAFRWATVRTASTSIKNGSLAKLQALPSDGQYCIKVTAIDKVGNKSEAAVNIRIDTQPPAAPVIGGKAENITDARVSWTSNAEPDLAGYDLYKNGVKHNSKLLTGTTYLDSGLTTGEYTYWLRAIDKAGNESMPSNEVSIKIDIAGPNAKIRSPQNNARVSGIVDIKGTAHSMDDFREYRLYIGRGQSPAAWTLIRTSPVSEPYGVLAQWNTIGMTEEEQYSIRLQADDINGNTSSHQITVTIDNMPPASPVLLAAVSTVNDVGLTWKVNTEQDLAGYLLYRNDQLANADDIVTGNLTPYLLAATEYQDIGLPDGTYRYYLVAMDTAGNVSDESNLIEVSIDTHPPHAVLSEPADGAKFDNKTHVRAESSDLDIASVQFMYKKAQDPAWITLGTPVSRQPFIAYIDPAALGLAYGNYNLSAVATDLAGKSDPSPAFITVTYTDITAPTEIRNLKASINGSDLKLTWTANLEHDLAGYNIYRISGGARTQINSTMTRDTLYIDSGLADGDYSYEVTAVDIASNESRPSAQASAKVYAPVIAQPYTPSDKSIIMAGGSMAAANSSVEIFADSGTGPVSQGIYISDADGAFSFSALLAPGENRLTAKSTDASGNVSRISDMVVVVYSIPPAAPSGLAAAVQDHDVDLAWDSNAEQDVIGYNLFRDGQKLNAEEQISSVTAGASSSYWNGYSSGNAVDMDPLTFWLSAYSPLGFDPVWHELSLVSKELISGVEIDWVPGYIGKNYEIQAWSGYAWIPVQKIKGNTEAKNRLNIKPSYGTDRLRIFITDIFSTDIYQMAGISEIRMFRDVLINSETYIDAGLSDGRYSYRVTAVNNCGFEGPLSDEAGADIGDVTPPSAPLDLTASASVQDIALVWSANIEADLAGYNVYRLSSAGWNRLNATPITGAAYIDEKLPNGTYTYRATAIDAAGNESLPSNEAPAVIDVVDITAPFKPILFFPAIAGMPVALYDSRTEVNGLADPGSIVTLFRDGELAGTATALSDNLAETYPLDPSWETVSLSPDGRTMAYADNNYSLWLRDLASGVTKQVVKYGYSPIWSPDGSRLAYEFDENRNGEWNYLIGIYDIRTSGVSVLTETSTEPYIDEYRPSWSSDGTRIAFLRYSGGSYNSWVKDLASGAESQVTWNANVDKQSLSPDGRRIAYYDWHDYSLHVADIISGENIVVDDQADPDSFDWAPDSRRLAFISWMNENSDAYSYDADSGIRTRLTGTSDVESGVLWSPDGSSILLVRTGSDWMRRSVWLMPAAVQDAGRQLSPELENLAYFSWGKSGGIVYIDQDELTVIYPQGHFSSGDISLNAGENIFSAVSADAAGNVSMPSDEISVTFDSAMLPDLSVSSSDIYLYPQYPVAGSKETVNIAVWNKGKADAANVEADVYMWDSVENIELVASEKIPVIAAGYAGIIGFNMDTTGKTGKNRIIVVVDSADRIIEQSESNNCAEKEIIVLGEAGISMTTSLAANAFSSMHEFDIDIAITNSDQPFEGTVETAIEDEYGYEVETLGAINITVPYGTLQKGLRWNTGSVFAGQYRVHSVLKAAAGMVKENIVPFSIIPDMDISSSIVTDRYLYGPNENVQINSIIKNNGLNFIVPALTSRLMIKDTTGKLMMSEERVLSNILPYAAVSFDSAWNSGLNSPGDYTVTQETYYEGRIVSSSTATLRIDAVAEIAGTIAVSPQRVLLNSPVQVSYTASNFGNADAEGIVLSLIILDSETTSVMETAEIPVNLATGSNYAGQAIFATNGYGLKAYTAVLQYTYRGRTAGLARASFNVADGMPPSVTIISPTDGNLFRSAFDVAVNAADDTSGIESVEYRIDSGAWRLLSLADRASGRFAAVWDPVLSDNGTHAISFRATDMAGNTSMPVSSSFIIDTLPPVLEIIHPVEGCHYEGAFDISALAADSGTGIEKAEFQMDGGIWKHLPAVETTSGKYSAAFVPLLSDEGGHAISFRALDRAGNMSPVMSTNITIGLISGGLAAQPSAVYQGEDITFTYSIKNNAFENLTATDLQILIIDPDTMELKQALAINANIPANTTATGSLSAQTVNLPPKMYTASLAVSAAAWPETRILASTDIEVKVASLEAGTKIPDVTNLLVWINDKCRESESEDDQHEDHDCVNGHLIMKILCGEITNCHISFDRKDFEKELRNPFFTDIMILGDHHSLEDNFRNELREKVYSGTGLIASLWLNHGKEEDDHKVRDSLFGVRHKGAVSGTRHIVLTHDSSITEKGLINVRGKAENIDMGENASAVGWIAESAGEDDESNDKKADKKQTETPAIVINEYGRGRAVYFAFDLEASLSSRNIAQLSEIIKRSLSFVHRPLDEGNPHPGLLLPVEIKVKSLSGSFDTMLSEIYPADVKLYDMTAGKWIASNPWSISLHLSPAESKAVVYYALLPDKAGIYNFRTEVGYIENSKYSFFGNLDLSVKAEKDSSIMTTDIINELKLIQTSAHGRARINKAVKYLENVQKRTIKSGRIADRNILDILKAIDSIMDIESVNIAPLRLKLDDLLLIWESRYYFDR